MKFSFDIKFQLQILKLMTYDEDFLLKCSLHLKEDFFENDFFGYFFRKTVEYYNKYSKTPDAVYFLNEIKKFEGENVIGEYLLIYNRIKDADIQSDQYIKDQLKEFIKRNVLVSTVSAARDIYKDAELADDTIAFMMNQLETAFNLNFNDDDWFKLSDIDKILDEYHKNKNLIVPIGVPDIDKALGGGLSPGDMCLFMGDSGSGKSMFLMNIAVNAMFRGLKVVHINLEGKKIIPITRYLSRMSGIKYGDIKERKNEDYKEVANIYDNKMYMKHCNLEKNTIEDIRQGLKDLYKKFQFQMVVVDYGDLLKTKDKMDFRHQQTEVFRELARLADYYNVIMLTATQATRPENDNEDWITMRRVNESYEKARVAPIIITINRNERDVENNRVRLFLCKNREGEGFVKVGCYSDYQNLIPYSTKLGFYNPKELEEYETTFTKDKKK